MPSSSRHEAGTAAEMAQMYSELDQDDGAALEKDNSEEFSDLRKDNIDLEQKLRRLKMWTCALAVLLASCAIALMLTLTSSRGAKLSMRASSPVPDMPFKPVTFQRNDLFANNTNPNSDKAWSFMMPAGDGFVVVKDADKFGLQPGKDSTQGPLYDISVFHQLHCLKHIRLYLYSLLENAQLHRHDVSFEIFLNSPDEHVAHCFDYIRQALMCNADMTVEWPRVEKDGSRFAVDGWGIDHQCKDWSSIMEWMEANRFHQPWE